jgi:hypothetical protein
MEVQADDDGHDRSRVHHPLLAHPCSPALVRDWVRGSFAAGTWTMGLYGAIAEFEVDGDAVDRSDVQGDVSFTTNRGALRLSIPASVQVFARQGPATTHDHGADLVVLAVPRDEASRAVTRAWGEPDEDGIWPEDRSTARYDLDIASAVASFGVRTDDEGLARELDRRGHQPWPGVIAELGPMLVEVSPHRVVRSGLGRIEVYTPIPAPNGTSPDGPHTHLLPRLLQLGRELPPRLDLPAALAPAAMFYPPPGTLIDLPS